MCNKTINGIWLTHDIKNYPDLGQCYLPNIDQGLDNSWYHAQPIIVYCFGIILTGPLIFVQLGPRLQPLTSAVGSHCLDDWATSHVTISRVLLNQQPLFFFFVFSSGDFWWTRDEVCPVQRKEVVVTIERSSVGRMAPCSFERKQRRVQETFERGLRFMEYETRCL